MSKVVTKHDAERGLYVFVCSGEIGVKNIRLAARELYSRKDYDAKLPSLWDLRTAALWVSASEVMQGKQSTNVINGLRPTGKTAWVVSSHLDKALLNIIYDEHNWATSWAYFDSLEEAYAWLT